MKINPAIETTITFGDLEDIRTVLLIARQHHEAKDISDSAASMLDEVRYRSITTEIVRILQRLEGIIGDLLMSQLDEDEEEVDLSDPDGILNEEPEEDEEEEEELEPLGENPLGTREIKPSPPAFEWDEE